MDITAQSEFFVKQAAELVEQLEYRTPDVNVGVAWRPTADGRAIIVGGEVELFRKVITEVDPELEHEPVIQYCRDLKDDEVKEDIYDGKLVAVGANIEEAIDRFYELFIREM